MSFYIENLNLFKNKIPPLYDAIINKEPIFSLEFEKVNDTLNYQAKKDNKTCYIHSFFDINEEMKQTFKKVDKNVSTLIIYGLGCGYALKYVKENYKSLKNIIVVEPSLDMFKIFIDNFSVYNEITQYDNVTFIVNQNQDITSLLLLEYIKNKENNSISMVFNISYRTLFEGYFEKINEDLVNHVLRTKVNIATAMFFREQWIANPLINLKRDGQLIDSLFNKFNGKSAILVSAGPSLNKNIHLLEAAKDRAFIITAGTASKLLDSKKIEPHLRFAMDGDPLERKIFGGISEDNSTLVYSDRIFHEIIPLFQRRMKMILDADFLTQYIYRKSKIDFTACRSGFSVANTALDVLIRLGFKNIIFLGQDLCYTKNKVYADGSGLENLDIDYTQNNGYIKTNDIFGNEVYTNEGFLRMKVLMEEIIVNNPNSNYINATEGGIGLNGTAIKSLQQVLDEDLREKFDYENFINGFYDDNKIVNHLSKINKVILSLDDEVDQIIKINDVRLKLLKKLDRYLKNGLGFSKIESELMYIDSFEDELKKIDFYRDCIVYSMDEVYKVFVFKYNYSGGDIKLKVTNGKKRIQNISLELQRHLNFIKSCIEEYKQSEIEKPSNIFS